MNRPYHIGRSPLVIACHSAIVAAAFCGLSLGSTIAQVPDNRRGTSQQARDAEADELERSADALERAADAATAEAEAEEAEREAAADAQAAREGEGSEEQLYYDLSSEADHMQLIGLDTIDGDGSHRSVLVVDLYRGSQKFGLLLTWQIDCARSRMKIVRAMEFEPGSAGIDKEIDGEAIATTASPTSRRIAQLTCTGQGPLITSRMHQESIIDIAAAFWGR